MTRREAGRKAQSNGANAEAALDAAHEGYERAGHYVEWRGPRVEWKGRGGSARPVAVGKGPPDLAVIANGRSFITEVKSRAGHLLPLDAIESHQAEALDRATRAGATTGILVTLGEALGVWWWLAWGSHADPRSLSARWWRGRVRRQLGQPCPIGEGSVSLAELEAGAGVRCVGGDWLKAAQAEAR